MPPLNLSSVVEAIKHEPYLVYRHDYTAQEHQVAVYLHELRLLSVIFGLGTVLLAYASAKIVRLGEGIALSVGLFVALLPKELVVSSVVTNDSLVIMLCAAALTCFLLAERARVESRYQQRHLAVLGMGVALGAAAITKFNSLPVAAVLLLLVAWPVVRILVSKYVTHTNSPLAALRPLCADVVTAGLAFLLISGWWFIRNDRIYKSPLATRAADRNVEYTTGGIYHPASSPVHALLSIAPHQLFDSFWYDGSWNNLQLPVWMNAILAVLGSLSLILGAWALVHGRSLTGLQVPGLLACVLAALVACVQVANQTSHVEGRIAFVALCAFALIATMGMKTAFERIGRAWTGILVWPAVLLALNVYVLAHFTLPLGGL